MKKIMLLCLLGLLALSASAFGDTLNGQNGTLNYLFPNTGTIYETHTFTAPAIVNTLGGLLVNTIGGNTININLSGGFYFVQASFNGEQFIFPGFTITGVTNLESIPAVITFDAHDIFVNFGSVSQLILPTDFVNLTVAGTSGPGTIPEPSSLLLLGTGLIGLAGRARKFFQT